MTTSDLEQLIREMDPQLRDGEWAFCVVPEKHAILGRAVAVFREDEGVTVIIPHKEAKTLGFEVRYVAAWITLNVYSDLNAVGFLAVISRALAGAGISCNVFSAVHHDHLFVAVEDGKRAVEVLRRL